MSLLLLLLFAPNVKGKWVDSNFQIIDLLVPPRAAGVAGTLIFVHIANFATLQPGLGSSTVDQVLKYTKYPKHTPSTSTGQVLIFSKST